MANLEVSTQTAEDFADALESIHIISITGGNADSIIAGLVKPIAQSLETPVTRMPIDWQEVSASLYTSAFWNQVRQAAQDGIVVLTQEGKLPALDDQIHFMRMLRGIYEMDNPKNAFVVISEMAKIKHGRDENGRVWHFALKDQE